MSQQASARKKHQITVSRLLASLLAALLAMMLGAGLLSVDLSHLAGRPVLASVSSTVSLRRSGNLVMQVPAQVKVRES